MPILTNVSLYAYGIRLYTSVNTNGKKLNHIKHNPTILGHLEDEIFVPCKAYSVLVFNNLDISSYECHLISIIEILDNTFCNKVPLHLLYFKNLRT